MSVRFRKVGGDGGRNESRSARPTGSSGVGAGNTTKLLGKDSEMKDVSPPEARDHPRTKELKARTEEALRKMDIEPSVARALAEEGRDLAEELGDEASLMQNLLALGTARVAEAEYERAETELRQAFDLAQKLGDQGRMVDILRGLVRCAFLTRRSEAALLRALQGLQVARESGDETRQAFSHNDLGLVYGNLGNFELALEHLLAGLRILQAEGSNRLAPLLNNIGNVYIELDNHEEALGLFQSALNAFRQDGAWRGEAIALGNIGRACSRLGEEEQALEAFRKSLEIYEARGDSAYRPPALARLGSALASAGEDAEAQRAFDAALSGIATSAHKEFKDEVLRAAGRYHLDRGEPARAIELYSAALEALPEDEITRRLDEIHSGLAEAYERSGDLAAALRHFKEFHRVRLKVSEAATTGRLRGHMLQFDVERARQQEEIFRLRNVELAKANADLQALQERLEAKNRELHQISIEDALTGLHNRRYLDLQLGVEVSRARRHDRPLCAAMCDIDHFKPINDRFSHAVGDEVLRRVAGLFRETARATDIVSRYGGEEFLFVLSETDLSGAEVLTERLRKRVSDYPWDDLAVGLRVTLSIGVAQLGPRGDADRLIAEADARLYEAKRAGRDRVVA